MLTFVRWALLCSLYLIQRGLAWVHRQLHPVRVRWSCRTHNALPCRVFAQPKPTWVKTEIIRLKAVMPQTGCRTIAHHFNRRWRNRRQMTVSKTYVADMCQRHQYLILRARRKLKHRVPRPMRRNRVWGCDLFSQDGLRWTDTSRAGDSRSCESGVFAVAAAREQILVDAVAGTRASREAVWPATISTDGQRGGVGLSSVPVGSVALGDTSAMHRAWLPLAERTSRTIYRDGQTRTGN